MEYPTFQIGELSKMVGIAPETIRYYERKRVFSSMKQKENGYRLFAMPDVCAINKVRAFLQYGFSIDEAKQILDSPEIESTEYALMNRAAELQQSISEQMIVLNSIHKRLLYTQTVISNLGKYRVTEMPSLFFVRTFDCRCRVSDGEDTALIRWINNQSIAYPCILLDRSAFLEGRSQMKAMGMCIWERDLLDSRQTIPGRYERMSQPHCLYTAVRLQDADVSCEALSLAAEEAGRRHLTVTGDVLGRTVVTQREDGQGIYYMELWIPVA